MTSKAERGAREQEFWRLMRAELSDLNANHVTLNDLFRVFEAGCRFGRHYAPETQQPKRRQLKQGHDEVRARIDTMVGCAG